MYIVYSMLSPVLLALGNTTKSAIFSVFLAAVTSIPVLTVAHASNSLQALVLTTVGSSVLAAVCALGVIYRAIEKGPVETATGPSVRSMIAYMAPLLGASGIALVGLRMDHLIVSRHFGHSTYASYAVGAFEIPLFGILQASVSSVLLPKFAALAERRSWTEITFQWRRALEQSSTIVYPLAAGLFVVADPFIATIFGEKFRSATPIFRTFLLLAPDLIGSVVYLAAVFALANMGVRIIGPVGATIGVVVSTVGLGMWLAWLTQRATGGQIRMQHMYPPAVLLRFPIYIIGFWLANQFPFLNNTPKVSILILNGILASALICGGLAITTRRHRT
jgi:O-antigen/teichoic acid export membrane protein